MWQAADNTVKECRGHSRFRRTAIRLIFKQNFFPAPTHWPFTCIKKRRKCGMGGKENMLSLK